MSGHVYQYDTFLVCLIGRVLIVQIWFLAMTTRAETLRLLESLARLTKDCPSRVTML